MRCPVCEGERFHTKAIAGVTIHCCRSCGLRTTPLRERRGTSYADVDVDAYERSIGAVRQMQAEEIVAFAREHGADGEWLDVGCGYGYVLDAARRGGFRIRGIEPNAIAAAAARAREIDVHHGQLDASTNAADIVSTLDVLEHLGDLDGFARLVKQKARRVWLIKVPSSDGLFFRIAHLLRLRGAIERLWQTQYEHPHLVYFDESSLSRFLARHGFDVVAVRYLHEVSARTIVPRLRLVRDMPLWKARSAIPIAILINLIERVRRKSDALVVLARVP
ncbi:MAG TPA: class I SAM-dependent methyltransferase [Thermoanaerobaculia bacterium]|nr:class I SAM-dependent methyltransferase [Thermoanaerobaculia bacterium]